MPQTKEQRRAMFTIRNMLLRFEETKEKHFDLGVWRAKHNCKTSACAIGWACRLPSIKKLGLQMVCSEPSVEPFNISSGFPAIRYALGLTYEEARHFFAASTYKNTSTPTVVAKRIDHWLKTGELL
jgi:hypothetical protein